MSVDVIWEYLGVSLHPGNFDLQFEESHYIIKINFAIHQFWCIVSEYLKNRWCVAYEVRNIRQKSNKI